MVLVSILYMMLSSRKNYFSCFKQKSMFTSSFVSIPSLVLEDAKWSRGDSGRPARAHKVRVAFNVHERDAERVENAFSDFEVRRSEA